MNTPWNRRDFLKRCAASGASASGLSLAAGLSWAADPPRTIEHTLTTISGKPRERGQEYGTKFKENIRYFHKTEIHDRFKSVSKDLHEYAVGCLKEIGNYSPTIVEELKGIAEATELKLEDVVLMAAHEELGHWGIPRPKNEHRCHAVGAGPPITKGDTYLGQSYDWIVDYSHLLNWKLAEGPSVLAYGFPGMWVSLGVNSAGIALCGTSASGGSKQPRVGIPYYVWAAHILYQDTFKAAVEESKRAKHAGWFAGLLADDQGHLVNVEASPTETVVEEHHGCFARAGFGSRRMTRTPEGEGVKLPGQAGWLEKQMTESKSKVDDDFLKGILAAEKVSHRSVDLVVFNATRRKVHITRGPGPKAKWKTFGFE